ncbi:hypothetical protein [Streptococcus hyointestinalis]|uniref:hypothetical protein n=1 Tax=Streptococcus hyointestinalis TaxID=1337 RepID=UPI003F98822C
MNLFIDVLISLFNVCVALFIGIYFRLWSLRNLYFSREGSLFMRLSLSCIVVLYLAGLIVFLVQSIVDPNVNSFLSTLKFVVYVGMGLSPFAMPLEGVNYLTKLDMVIRTKVNMHYNNQADSEFSYPLVIGYGDAHIMRVPMLKTKEHRIQFVVYRNGEEVITYARIDVTKNDLYVLEHREDMRDNDVFGYALFRVVELYSDNVDYCKQLRDVTIPKMTEELGVLRIDPKLFYNDEEKQHV